jgi:hypothetical protein
MVPYSNPGGNNQTTPGASNALPAINTLNPIATPTPINPTAAATVNPLVPASAIVPSSIPTAGTGSQTVSGAAYNQLNDIYGAAGGTLTNFMNSMSGTNSAVLQEYIQSLAPQEATADANLHASLGAGGVSANSSVAALGEANLQAQETSAIAGEAANLTESQQSLEAKLIESTLPAAQQQVVDSSPLHIFGQVLGDIGSAVGDVMGLGSITGMFGGAGASVPSMGTVSDPGIANFEANNGPAPSSGFTPGFLEGLGG